MLHKFLSPLAHLGKYKFNEKHLPKWHFYLPQKESYYFFVLKVYVHNTLLACPIQATVISWSFKMLARIWFYLPRAIGQVLINVTPCISLQNTKLYPRHITWGGWIDPLVAFGGMFVKKPPSFFGCLLAELVPMKVRTIKFWLSLSLVMGL